MKLTIRNPIYYYLMSLSFILCALLTPSVIFVNADATLQQAISKFKVNEVVAIPSYVGNIKIKLGGNFVRPGDTVPAKSFRELEMKDISWDNNNYEAMHTVMMLDLDRGNKPANSTQGIYNQFTSLNIPANFITAGQSIVAFEAPTPPCTPSSKHRILVLALHQDQNIDISDVASMSASSGYSIRRENIRINEFITKHRLEIVAATVLSVVGDGGGLCNGSPALSASYILISMVMMITVYASSYNRRISLN